MAKTGGGIDIESMVNARDHNGNQIRCVREKNTLKIDVYVTNLDRLYLSSGMDDFGPVGPQLDPTLLLRIVTCIRSQHITKTNQMQVVFHLAASHIDSGRGEGFVADFKQTIPRVFESVSEVMNDRTRTSIRYLVIGLIFLFLCMGTAELLKTYFLKTGVIEGIAQALSVFGWVILWAPIEYIVFEWAKVARTRQWVKRFFQADVATVAWNKNSSGRQ